MRAATVGMLGVEGAPLVHCEVERRRAAGPECWPVEWCCHSCRSRRPHRRRFMNEAVEYELRHFLLGVSDVSPVRRRSSDPAIQL
jgi:hypothetical protein